VARAARERKGVTVNDVTQEPDFLPNPLLPGTRSELAVPMMVGENVIGVFDVQSDLVGRFTEADVSVQTTLAAQIASAIQNARSFEQTQAALLQSKEAQQLTSDVIDSTDDWIFIKDQDHRYRLVNRGYAKSLHIPKADFIGKNDLDLGFPEELVKGNPEKGISGFWADDRAVMDSGVSKNIPNDVVTIDGEIRVLDTVKIPLRNADNNVWGVLAFARDMTERRRLEELTRHRAEQQETLNLISQKILSTTSVEDALKITARELGHALGQKPTLAMLEPSALVSDKQHSQ
jgi:PAS domain S-box-containing protein